MKKEIKNQLLTYLELKRHNAVTDIKNSTYVLENITDRKDIAYNETKKHIEDRIKEIDLLLTFIEAIKAEV